MAGDRVASEAKKISLAFLKERLRMARWSAVSDLSTSGTGFTTVSPPTGAEARYLLVIEGQVYAEIQVWLPRGTDLPERVDRWEEPTGAPFVYVTDTRAIALGIHGASGKTPVWMPAPVFGSPSALRTWAARLYSPTGAITGSGAALGMADKEFLRAMKRHLRQLSMSLPQREVQGIRDMLLDRLSQLSAVNVNLARNTARLWPTHRLREQVVGSVWHTLGFRGLAHHLHVPASVRERAPAIAEVILCALTVFAYHYDFGSDMSLRDVMLAQDNTRSFEELLETVAGHSQA